MINRTQEEIMMNWGVDNTDTPLVSVKCMTFNHENYIAQALDGFLMQKTTFPFEVLVHDDASTDKTANIIREYEAKFPKIVKGIYETENQYSNPEKFSHHKKIDAAIKGKYIAFCEGDDYWIDENKLQMQIEFLESNPEYGMCYTKAKQFVQSKKKYLKKIGNKSKGFRDLLIHDSVVPTLTTCFRTDLFKEYFVEICPQKQNWLMGDYPMWLFFSKKSKIFFLNKTSAVYRILTNSASHSSDKEKIKAFYKSLYNVKQYFCEKYNYEIFPDYFSLLLECKIQLNISYNKDYAKKMRLCLRKMHYFSIINVFYYLVSYSKFSWSFLKLLLRH